MTTRIADLIAWLLGTRDGMFAVLGACLVFFTVLAWLLERGTRRRYHDHADDMDGDEPYVPGEEMQHLGKMIGRARAELDAAPPTDDEGTGD